MHGTAPCQIRCLETPPGPVRKSRESRPELKSLASWGRTVGDSVIEDFAAFATSKGVFDDCAFYPGLCTG